MTLFVLCQPKLTLKILLILVAYSLFFRWIVVVDCLFVTFVTRWKYQSLTNITFYPPIQLQASNWSSKKSSSDSIRFTFRITVVLFFFFFFCFLKCTCLMCLSRLWESLHIFEHWAQRNSCVVDSFSILTNVPNPLFDIVLNEADQRLQDLPCQTSERGSAHWNVKSRLHPELKGWIPPSPTCQGGASDWPARRPRGRSRPSPTSRGERQRPWEKSKREETAWQLKTLVKC